MNKNKNYILLFLILFFKNQFSSNDFCFKIIENFHKNYNYFRKKIKNNKDIILSLVLAGVFYKIVKSNYSK